MRLLCVSAMSLVLIAPFFACSDEAGESGVCVVHEKTVRLTGHTVGEGIPDGPVLIEIYEDTSYRCDGVTTPGDRIGQFSTTFGQDFDFDVVVKYSSDEPPYLSILAILDLNGDGGCDPEEAMGTLWIPPDEAAGVTLELIAGECRGLL